MGPYVFLSLYLFLFFNSILMNSFQEFSFFNQFAVYLVSMQKKVRFFDMQRRSSENQQRALLLFVFPLFTEPNFTYRKYCASLDSVIRLP